MAWQTITYRLTSDCPMLMHNGQTADPLNHWSKQMKAISGKRKKTDADYEELAKIEFMAALYIDKTGPIIPAANIDSMLVNAAEKLREGPLVKSGVFCLKSASLEYDGPRDPEGLWTAETFRHVAIVRVQMARVARTRPVFNEWAADVSLNIEDSLVNVSQVDTWMNVAGSQIGLGDWRPQHGRFTALRLK
jgi:hypothetical protein